MRHILKIIVGMFLPVILLQLVIYSLYLLYGYTVIPDYNALMSFVMWAAGFSVSAAIVGKELNP